MATWNFHWPLPRSGTPLADCRSSDGLNRCSAKSVGTVRSVAMIAVVAVKASAHLKCRRKIPPLWFQFHALDSPTIQMPALQRFSAPCIAKTLSVGFLRMISRATTTETVWRTGCLRFGSEANFCSQSLHCFRRCSRRLGLSWSHWTHQPGEVNSQNPHWLCRATHLIAPSRAKTSLLSLQAPTSRGDRAWHVCGTL